MKHKLALFSILFIGLILRLYGTNWDQGFHLHPDERFLTMVGTAVSIPSTLAQYLDPLHSSFNPVNKGYGFYVYGTFPLLINKIIAQFLSNDTYDLFHLQGRALSALADLCVIYVVFRIVELLEKQLQLSKNIKFGAAFLYAIAVLPIQLSHFFAVDTFLNLFCWASLYFAVKLAMCSCNTQHVTHNVSKCSMLHVACYMSLSGIFFGLALACKISALYFAPLIGIFVVLGIVRLRAPKRNLFIFPLLFLLCVYLALRLGSPYYFQTGNMFNPQISSAFINNIQILKSLDNPEMLFPSANQWISASPFLSIKNVIFFGLGPVYFLCAVLGAYLLMKKKNIFLIASILYTFIFIVYQSMQFAKTMRYLIFIYPLLAIFAAVGLQFLLQKIRTLPVLTCYMLHVTCYICILVWPLAFMSIYTKDHSRVAASKWIYKNSANMSTLTYEYWDDPLPLSVYNPAPRSYTIEEIHIFDPDTEEKWSKINSQLKRADYYIMSSNRGWGSIPTTPKRYPIASTFYADMFAAKRGFSLIKEFTSFPSLRYLGIPIDFPDQWAEEAFTVYDHPTVMIFKKQ